MYTVYLQHENYNNDGIQTTMPFLPNTNDWVEIPPDIRRTHWPNATDTLCVVEREHLFDESMSFYGTRLYLQDWEGNWTESARTTGLLNRKSPQLRRWGPSVSIYVLTG